MERSYDLVSKFISRWVSGICLLFLITQCHSALQQVSARNFWLLICKMNITRPHSSFPLHHSVRFSCSPGSSQLMSPRNKQAPYVQAGPCRQQACHSHGPGAAVTLQAGCSQQAGLAGPCRRSSSPCEQCPFVGSPKLQGM